MDKIFIVHFQPLEKYPPAMNLIRILSRKSNEPVGLQVISTHPGMGKNLFNVNGIIIHRVTVWNNFMNRLQRMIMYFQFNFKTLYLLFKNKPTKILYYETLSAGAPCLYKKWFNRNVELFIHYHEYTSPSEYQQGMILNRWLHLLEKRIYKKAVWVSHTNDYRADLFTKDLGEYAPAEVHSMPNYPPESWKDAGNKKFSTDTRIKFVYVGALSLETMYVEEFALYIKANSDRYFWDIYSDNCSADVIQFITDLNVPSISFKGGVQYDALPGILPAYDIGIILYKGHIPNYIYNAPNKLFEYLACGLDTWFPKEMVGSTPYIRSNTRPEVRAVDFKHLPHPLLVIGAEENFHNKFDFFAETSLKPLIQKLLINAR